MSTEAMKEDFVIPVGYKLSYRPVEYFANMSTAVRKSKD